MSIPVRTGIAYLHGCFRCSKRTSCIPLVHAGRSCTIVPFTHFQERHFKRLPRYSVTWRTIEPLSCTLGSMRGASDTHRLDYNSESPIIRYRDHFSRVHSAEMMPLSSLSTRPTGVRLCSPSHLGFDTSPPFSGIDVQPSSFLRLSRHGLEPLTS